MTLHAHLDCLPAPCSVSSVCMDTISLLECQLSRTGAVFPLAGTAPAESLTGASGFVCPSTYLAGGWHCPEPRVQAPGGTLPSSCTAKQCEGESTGSRRQVAPCPPCTAKWCERESRVRLDRADNLHTWSVELLSTEAEKGQVGVWLARARYSGVSFHPLWWRY